jgi:hypothetical protein
MLRQLLGESKAAHERAEIVLRLAKEQAFELYVGWATPLAAWETAVESGSEDDIERIRHGIVFSQSKGSVLFKPYWLGLVAEAWGRIDKAEQRPRGGSRGTGRDQSVQ